MREELIWRKCLKKVIREQGLTNKQVADRSGFRPEVISHMLNKPGFNPTVKTLEKIAKGLGISVCELFQGEDSCSKPDNSGAYLPIFVSDFDDLRACLEKGLEVIRAVRSRVKTTETDLPDEGGKNHGE